MAAVNELDLPLLDQNEPALVGHRLHEVLGDLARASWLARADIGYVVLERQGVVDVLRDRRLAFPPHPRLAGDPRGPGVRAYGRGLMTRSGEPHLRLHRLVAPAFSPSTDGRPP